MMNPAISRRALANMITMNNNTAIVGFNKGILTFKASNFALVAIKKDLAKIGRTVKHIGGNTFTTSHSARKQSGWVAVESLHCVR